MRNPVAFILHNYLHTLRPKNGYPSVVIKQPHVQYDTRDSIYFWLFFLENINLIV